MAEYISNLEGQDYARLMRLARLLDEGNSLVRLIADQPVTQWVYVVTPDSIEMSAKLERSAADGR